MFSVTTIAILLYVINLFIGLTSIYAQSEQFQLGMFNYEHGNYSKAITIFTDIIKLKNSLEKEKIKSLELLGIIYYIKGDKRKSRLFFGKLLDKRPNYSLDPLFVPPEIAVFFNSIKNERQILLKPLGTTEKNSGPKHKSYGTVLNFLPMGIGYYHNNRKKEGLFFSVTETLLLALNVGLYYYRNCGLKNCDDKYYSSSVVNEAKTLQTVQLVSGYLWIAMWGYNIIDLNFKF